MTQDKLKALLDELHKELEQAEHLDPDTRSHVENAASELIAVLAREDAAETHGAFDALRERLLSLEVEHPRVSAILGEAADTISKLGV